MIPGFVRRLRIRPALECGARRRFGWARSALALRAVEKRSRAPHSKQPGSFSDGSIRGNRQPSDHGAPHPIVPKHHRTILTTLFLVSLLLPTLSDFAAEELRGLWVDSFNPGLRNEPETRKLVADARRAGFNALFVEVRKRGDAYYQSAYEPRAIDVGPGFDPLRRLLALAHDITLGPRLEVHAWVVAFNIWNQETTPPPQANHPYRRHPDWLTRNATGARWDGENYAFDPGHPGVQSHTLQVAMDLVANYDIDGLHWDYIRYAGRDWGYNPVAVRRFNNLTGRSGKPAPDDPAWMQFRRDQVTALVRRFYLTAFALKPHLKISAATITWAPGVADLTQWTTSAAYSHVLQDWRAWMEEGILDLNIPMTYFRHSEHAEAFAHWSRFIKDHQYRRQAALGLGFYLNSLAENLAQIDTARRPHPSGSRKPPAGVLVYSYANPGSGIAPDLAFEALSKPVIPTLPPPFAEPAQVPAVPWKASRQFGHIRGTVTLASNGSPVDGASIEITGTSALSQRTDASGFFGAVDLAPGDFQVRVSAPGFETATADVTVQGGALATLEFSLTPLPVPVSP